jgi:hypothetical protein
MEITTEIPFTISSKWMEFLWINLTREINDLCIENYKTFLKEIKVDIISDRVKDSKC